MADLRNTGQRVVVNDPNAGRASLSPAASPVNTFIQPAAANRRVDKSDISTLAEALQGLQPELNQYARAQGIADDKADVAAGKVAYEKNRVQWNEAIKKGIVPAGASPHFRQGWMQSQLQVAGFDYDQKLREFYTANNLSALDDPNKFNDAVAQFNKSYVDNLNLDQYDPGDVAEAFLPMMKSAQQSLTTQHVNDRVKIVEDQMEQNTQNVLSNILMSGVQQDHFDAAGVASSMQGVVDNAMKFGLQGTKGNKMLVDSIISTASLASNNGKNPAYAQEIMSVLNHINTPFGPVANTNYAKEKIAAMNKQIQEEEESQVRWAWALQDRPFTEMEHQWAVERHQRDILNQYRDDQRWDWAVADHARAGAKYDKEQMSDQALTDITLQGMANPYDPQIREKVKALASVDAKAAQSAESWINNQQHGAFDGELTPGSNLAMQNFYLRLSADPKSVTMTDIVDAQNKFQLPTRYAQKMYDDMQSAKKYGENPLMKDEVVNELGKHLDQAIGGNEFDFDANLKAKAGMATSDFLNAKIDWLSKNPQGTLTEYRDYMRKLYQQLLQDYDVETGNLGPSAEKPNPYKK